MSELGEITEHLSTTERTSSDAERDSTLLKKMEFFLRQLAAKRPDEFRAIVVDVRSYGLVVELPDCLVTGLIHVSALPDDFYAFDSTRLAFIGRRTGRRYSLGRGTSGDHRPRRCLQTTARFCARGRDQTRPQPATGRAPAGGPASRAPEYFRKTPGASIGPQGKNRRPIATTWQTPPPVATCRGKAVRVSSPF